MNTTTSMLNSNLSPLIPKMNTATLTNHRNNTIASPDLQTIYIFIRSQTFMIISIVLICLSVTICFFYYFCDKQRKIVFNENFESALDDMARYEARVRIKERQIEKEKRKNAFKTEVKI